MIDNLVGTLVNGVDRFTTKTAVGAKLRPALSRVGRLVGITSRQFDPNALQNPVYYGLWNELIGVGDDPVATHAILKQWERDGVAYDRPDALRALLRVHAKPHIANYLLSVWEMQNRIEAVDTLPMNVCMDLSSLCNVQCKFCKYTHNFLPSEFLSVEHIKSIEWFPHVRWFNFSAGTAESIVHPQFVEIFNYVRDTFPHLHLSLLTNGRALREDRLNAFKDRLDVLYVSMSAANKEDYDAIIDGGSWDQFSANMRHMKRIFANATKTQIQAHFVLMRWNLHRALDYLDFAVDHGAHHVMFSNFYTHYIADLHKSNQKVLSDKFGFEDSLYFDRDRADEMFDRLEVRAKELGVSVALPPRFRDKTEISFGVRTRTKPPEDCFDPWSKLFLLWGWKSRREEATICCGLASDIGVYFDRDDVASIEGLRKLWNSPTLKAYRRSANGTAQNPICAKCRSVDRFDPAGHYPDQRDFFRHNGLPIPPHFENDAQPTSD